MFVRECWKPKSESEMFDLIEQNPWALLVSNGSGNDAGPCSGPFATNLPLLLARERRTLIGHIARANTHADALIHAKSPSLAIFEGPSSYITSSWYPARDMPPTVYYTAVHCYGSLTFQPREELRAALEELTSGFEAPVPNGWRTSEIPETEIARRLPAILGFELGIERLEAKFKLGQDEPRRDALAVAERLLASPNPRDRVLGEMTRRYNENRSA